MIVALQRVSWGRFLPVRHHTSPQIQIVGLPPHAVTQRPAQSRWRLQLVPITSVCPPAFRGLSPQFMVNTPRRRIQFGDDS